MAFGDLLKKAAEKGLGMAHGVVEKGKQLVEEQKAEVARKAEAERMEQERLEAEKKAEAEKRKKQAEERKRKEMEAILKPTCSKGDCLWNEGKFYFTCPEDCECERKLHTKKDWGKMCAVPEFWPYMKRIEKLGGQHFCGVDAKEVEISKDFMREFLPQYGPSYYDMANKFIGRGLDAENGMLNIFYTIKDAPKIKNMFEKLEFIYLNGWGLPSDGLFYQEICTNMSLYDRSIEDFEYTVKIFTSLHRDRRFRDIIEDAKEQFFDSEGNIKPAGIGGPQAGFYGDTLWNVIESLQVPEYEGDEEFVDYI